LSGIVLFRTDFSNRAFCGLILDWKVRSVTHLDLTAFAQEQEQSIPHVAGPESEFGIATFAFIQCEG
jgi:hypothetical protein